MCNFTKITLMLTAGLLSSAISFSQSAIPARDLVKMAEQGIVYNPNETSPTLQEFKGSVSDETWDVLFSFSCNWAYQPGVETDGNFIYTSTWNTNGKFSKYTMAGVWVEDFTITGVLGIRDLAFDGTYFYGGAAASTIYKMDFSNKILVATIPTGSVSVRHISYDPSANGNTGGFWTGNWSNLSLVSMTGTTLTTVTGLTFTGMYGTAYDPWTSGGPYLWLFDQGAGAGTAQLVHQFSIPALAITGVNHNVSDIPGYIAAEAIAGGAASSDDVVSGKFVLLVNLQQSNNLVGVYELALTANTSAPGAVTNLVITPGANGALHALLEWTNPSFDNGGNILTELTAVKIYRDNELINTVDNPPIGGNSSYTDYSVPNAAMYEYQVVPENSSGEGLPETSEQWIGVDVPAAVTNLLLTAQGTNGQLTWTNPSQGLHGGYYTGLTGYSIVRMPDNTLFEVADPVNQWIDYSVPGPGSYSYTVTTKNAQGNGGTATSNTALLSSGDLLLSEEFNGGTIPAGWSVVGLGQPNWSVPATNNAGGTLPELRLYYSPSFVGLSSMMSSAINTSGLSTLQLSFKHFIDWYGNGFTLGVATSSDNGATWNTIWSVTPSGNVGPETQTLSISDANVGSPNFRLGFFLSGDSYQLDNWYIDNILLSNVGPALEAPKNLTSIIVENDVTLNWQYGNAASEWLHWDNGSNYTGLGLGSPGQFECAARFVDLIPYDGWALTKIAFFPRADYGSTFTLKVYKGVNASTLLLSQPLSGLIQYEWNEVLLSSPVQVIAGEELWVSIAIDNADSDYPLGIDAGPAVDGYGDMICLDGVTWESMNSSFGLDYNHNIQAYVVEPTKGIQCAVPLVNNIIYTNTGFPVIAPSKDVISKTFNPSKGFLGFRVQRDGADISETISERTFTDVNVPYGIYTYTVLAVYDEGISAPSNPYTAFVLVPLIEVNPASVTQNVNQGSTAQSSLVITSIAAEPITYRIDVSYPGNYNPAVTSIKPAIIDHTGLSDQEAVKPDLNVINGGGVLIASEKVNHQAAPPKDNVMIRYDDGVNYDKLGFTSGGTFEVAAYFPASSLSQYLGMQLSALEFYIGDLPNQCKLKVYGQGTPNTPGALLSEEVITVTGNSWNLFDLSDPVLITGDDLWFGYEVTHSAGTYPAGYDAGPAIAGFGDMIYFSGNWAPLSSYGVNNNWNLAGILDDYWLSLSPSSGVLQPGELAIIDLNYDASTLTNGIYNANLNIYTNESNYPEKVIPVQLTVTGGVPNISVSTDLLDFGQIPLGASNTQTLEVSNTGYDILGISETTFSNPDFSLISGSASINPGESALFSILFFPSTNGIITGNMVISSNDPDNPEVTVSLSGTAYVEIPQNLTAFVNGYDVTLNWEPPSVITPQGLIGYNIYRDGIVAGYSQYSSYDDLNVTAGEHFYQVSAVFIEGESGITPEVYVLVGFANIEVNPSSFEETLENGTSVTREMIISNTGDIPLNFNIYTSSGSSLKNLIEYKQQLNNALPVKVKTGNSPENPFTVANCNPGGESSVKAGEEIIRYDNGSNLDAVGLTSGGTFQAAAYFPASVMQQYSGKKLSKLEFYIKDAPSMCKIKIYGPGTGNAAGALLHEENTPVGVNAWNIITLSNPVNITGEDLWIGYELTHSAGTFPAGYDSGPAIAGYGDMIYFSGLWAPLSGYGLNYNWNIAGYLEDSWLSFLPRSGSVMPGESMSVEVTFDATEIANGTYNTNIIINSNDIVNPQVNIPAQLTVYGGLPNISVSSDILEFGQVPLGSSSTQTLTVSNTGYDILEITETTFSNPDFSLVSGVANINPGEVAIFEISMIPSTTGVISGILTISNNDPDQPEVYVNLSGSAYLEVPQNLTANVSGYDVTLAWDPPVGNQTKGLLGYNVYRDGVLIDFSTITSYTDYLVTAGEHYYQVSAVYTEGESELTPGVYVFAGYAVINVNPLSFEENLESGTWSTQQMMISNTGDIPLIYEITTGLNRSFSPPAEPASVEHNGLSSRDLEKMNLNAINAGGLFKAAGKAGNQTAPPTDDEVIRWDDGTYFDAVGLTSGGTFEVASYFPAAQMSQYAGMKLSTLSFYIRDGVSSVLLKIYGPGTANTPGTLLHYETVAVNQMSWNTINLSTEVPVNGDDLWFGYEVTHPASTSPVGCDVGPAIAGFGDMIYFSGTWAPLSGYGLNYNWNLAATLVPEIALANDVGISAILSPNTGSNLNYEFVTIEVKNYGTESQSDIPVSYNLNGSVSVNGVVTGSLAPGTAVDYTFTDPANLSLVTTYNLNACTNLAGDENGSNNCKTKTITNLGNILFSEDFSSGYIPQGWTIQGPGQPNWSVASTGNAGGTAPELRFSWSPSFVGFSAMMTPPLNTTGANELHLSFTHMVDWYSTTFTCGVATTSDGGATWNTVWSINPTGNVGPQSVELAINNADVGSASFQLAFFFEGDSYEINYWFIDNVSLRADVLFPEWLAVAPLTGIVEPGQSATIDLTFDATSLENGIYNTELGIQSNADNSPLIIVPVILNVSGGVPIISASTELIDFGLVPVGDSTLKALVVTNIGYDLLEISEISFSNPDFSLSEGTFTILPGESSQFQIKFKPASSGSITGEMTIFCNDPYHPEVVFGLSGSGYYIIPDPIEIGVEEDWICNDGSGYYFGNVSTSGYTNIYWSTSGSGFFDNSSQIFPTYYPSAYDYIQGYVTIYVEVWGDFGYYYDYMYLNFTSCLPIEIGLIQDEVCNDGSSYYFGYATSSGYNTIIWYTPDGSGYFDDPYQLNPTYFPSTTDYLQGNITINVDVTGDFGFASDNMNLSFTECAFVDMGVEQDWICNDGSGYYFGTVTGSGYNYIQWYTYGNGYFDDPNQLNPTYYPSTYDYNNGYVYIYVEVSGLTNDWDDMYLYFNNCLPIEIGLDQDQVCNDGSSYYFGYATSSGYTSILWYSPDGTGYFDDPYQLNPTYYPGTTDYLQGYVSIYADVTGDFGFASDYMLLNFVECALVEIGLQEDWICSDGSGYYFGDVTASGYNDIYWSTTGSGYFDDIYVLNPIYYPSSNDYLQGGVTIYAEVYGNYGYDYDYMDLYFQQTPVVFAGNDATIEAAESYSPADATAINFNGLYWTTNGDGIFDNATILNPVYTPGISDIIAGQVDLCLHADSWCLGNYFDCVTLTILTSGNPDIVTDQTSILEVLETGQGSTHSLIISNGGDESLYWNLDIISEKSVPWMWVDVHSGTILAGHSHTTFVGFNTQGLEPGEYFASLNITSNDPDNHSLQIPVQLTVSNQETQTISIPQGWSGISSYVIPSSADVETLFEPVLSDLIILQSETAMYWPGENINTLGTWSTSEGYKIKVANELSLNITGIKEANRILQLNSGWTAIPVISECNVDAAGLFEGKNLIIVKEIAGWEIYWPDMEINTLQNLETGKAYYVLMESSGNIEFPVCGNKKNAYLPEFSPELNSFNVHQTPLSHTIAMPSVLSNEFRKGDVIRAFDENGQCAGVISWTGQNTAITLFGDDPVTVIKDGFVDHESLQFRLLRQSSEEEFLLEITFDYSMPDYEMKFRVNGLSVMSAVHLIPLNISDRNNESEVSIIPNPAKDEFRISVNDPSFGQGVLNIITMQGRLVKSVNIDRDHTLIKINDLESAVYIVKIDYGTQTQYLRLVKK